MTEKRTSVFRRCGDKWLQRKRIVVLSDLHSGHRAGLTPPKYWVEWDRWTPLQKECWYFYMAKLDLLRPIDCLVVNGDMVDGTGTKSGGTELLSSDMDVQSDMAAFAIHQARAPVVKGTFGTGYHTGILMDHEKAVMDKVKLLALEAGREVETSLESHMWMDVSGVVFDVKHHIGSSSIPYGKFTAAAKDRFQNLLWAEHEEQPKADVLIRSHVHYSTMCGEPGEWMAITTPALQAAGTKFGARRCSGPVHFGLTQIDVFEDGEVYMKMHKTRPIAQKQEAYVL